jgi:hypothetical protein
MVRSLFRTGILLVGLCGLATPAPAAPPAAPRPFSVYYRSKGGPTWHLFGVYHNEQSARNVLGHLTHDHYQAQLRVTSTRVPPTPPRAKSGLLPAHETVTLAKANELFHLMARQHDIAFRFPIDGCYARAELMIERMRAKGAHSHRVWAFANGDSLYARTKNNPRGYVTWSYHVAPVLRVRHGHNAQTWYVIDPSLFTRPVTIAQWEAAMRRDANSHRPYLTVTRVGQAPTLLNGRRANGTGYWPGSDPREGLHNHAVATMRKYKPWEGKQPPAGVVLRARRADTLVAWASPRHEALTDRRLALAA